MELMVGEVCSLFCLDRKFCCYASRLFYIGGGFGLFCGFLGLIDTATCRSRAPELFFHMNCHLEWLALAGRPRLITFFVHQSSRIIRIRARLETAVSPTPSPHDVLESESLISMNRLDRIMQWPSHVSGMQDPKLMRRCFRTRGMGFWWRFACFPHIPPSLFLCNHEHG